MNKDKIVYIVHHVDVEGPLTETIEATFERMYDFGLSRDVSICIDNLHKIQDGVLSAIDPDLSSELKKVFSKRYLNYLKDWNEIDSSIIESTSKSFRLEHCSKEGDPYKYSWYIYDYHEGFKDNPRFRERGTHKIFDHYMKELIKDNIFNDGIYWHYHQPSISGQCLENNTCWTNSVLHEEIVARRIIERNWYFSCFRAGFYVERNDISHWLEMFIPFDYTARYMSDNKAYSPGDEFDWRNTPNIWGAWHPDWYDYRVEGNMKRYLFRCTDLATYNNHLNKKEVEEAFEQASERGTSILSYYNHDYRDMKLEVNEAYPIITDVSKKYPDINWKFVNALEAAQNYLKLFPRKPNLSVKQKNDLLFVNSENKIFGPQPFLAIQEGDKFFRDNFTKETDNSWVYRFRNLNNLKAFGVAANDPSGLYDIKVKIF